MFDGLTSRLLLINEKKQPEYFSFCLFSDNDKLEKIAATIGAKLTPRDIRHTDPYVPLHLIFHQWLPIARAVFGLISYSKIDIFNTFKNRYGRPTTSPSARTKRRQNRTINVQ